MDADKIIILIGLVLVCIVVALALSLALTLETHSITQKQAIERGYARWNIERKFEWIEQTD